MGDGKRWCVTYTKHLKKKRKAYHDGFLHLLPSNKVMLYDETEQLLDSMLISKHDDLHSGNSIQFPSFLVDIGHLQTQTNPNNPHIAHLQTQTNPNNPHIAHLQTQTNPNNPHIAHLQTQTNPNNPHIAHLQTQTNPNNPHIAHLQTHKTPVSTPPNTIKLTPSLNLRKRPPSIQLTPSHNLIKEFKKNQLVNYSMPSTAPTTPSFQEWEALYTAQITKKAKKYHDGFLRLLFSGSRDRQIVLYDLNKNQLDKRFLNKDEIISEGESMTFDSYLVEIGGPMGGTTDDTDVKKLGINCKLTDVKKQGINCKLTDGREKVAAPCGPFRGHPQQNACSDTPIESNLHILKVDKTDVRRRFPSHTPLRDAYQILSNLKKPVTQDRCPVAEKNPSKQCLPQYSESVQLDGSCKDVEGSLAVPIDLPLARTTESNDRKVAAEGYITSGACTGNQPEVQDYDLSTPAFNAGNLCNKIEIPPSSQQIKAKYNAVEPSTITEQEVEFSQCSRSDANSDHTLPTSAVANFISSLPSVTKESEAYQDPHLTPIPETDMPSEEQVAQDVSTTKWSSKDPTPTETDNSAKVGHLQPILDYPSFDLGF